MALISNEEDINTDDSPLRDEHEEDVRSSSLNAEVHANHFKKIFRSHYGLSVSEWGKACIADNTSTNRKTAKILNLPHVGCNNHKLNLDIEDWAKQDVALLDVLNSIGMTMKSAKNSLKNAAILSELTPLKPVIYNKTRWSGKFDMLSRFLRIRCQLIQVAADEESNMHVNDSPMFLQSVKKFHRSMEVLNKVTIKLQQRCKTLSSCRVLLDYIIQKKENDADIMENRLFQCNFTPKRIQTNGSLTPNPHFESGVVKLQRNKASELTDAERGAVESLKIDIIAIDNEGGEEEKDNDDGDSIAAELDKVEEEERAASAGEQQNASYVNCNFIYGSCAEVERLWSMAKHILTEDRRGMMDAVMFEIFIFLKVNRRLWELGDVVDADHIRRRANREGSDLDEEE